MPVALIGAPAVTDRGAQSCRKGVHGSTNKQVTLRQSTETGCADCQDPGYVGGKRKSREQKGPFPGTHVPRSLALLLWPLWPPWFLHRLWGWDFTDPDEEPADPRLAPTQPSLHSGTVLPRAMTLSASKYAE